MSSTIQKRHHRGILRFCIAFTVTAIASLSNSTTLWGDTVRVPQDHKTIQEGIDAAEDGDIVIVDAGTYRERIQLKPGVTVRTRSDLETQSQQVARKMSRIHGLNAPEFFD